MDKIKLYCRTCKEELTDGKKAYCSNVCRENTPEEDIIKEECKAEGCNNIIRKTKTEHKSYCCTACRSKSSDSAKKRIADRIDYSNRTRICPICKEEYTCDNSHLTTATCGKEECKKAFTSVRRKLEYKCKKEGVAWYAPCAQCNYSILRTDENASDIDSGKTMYCDDFCVQIAKGIEEDKTNKSMVNCTHCDNIILGSSIHKEVAQYCSFTCYVANTFGESAEKGKCSVCNKEYTKAPQSQGTCCSVECMIKEVNGIIGTDNGYNVIAMKDYITDLDIYTAESFLPMTTDNSFRTDESNHRYLDEVRYTVHHIDGDINNCNPENLVILTRSDLNTITGSARNFTIRERNMKANPALVVGEEHQKMYKYKR